MERPLCKGDSLMEKGFRQWRMLLILVGAGNRPAPIYTHHTQHKHETHNTVLYIRFIQVSNGSVI